MLSGGSSSILDTRYRFIYTPDGLPVGRRKQPTRRQEMSTIEESIEVNAPLRSVYDQWTQFEEFPRFMEGVEEVKQLDDKRLYWRAEVAGKILEWDSEIFEQ